MPAQILSQEKNLLTKKANDFSFLDKKLAYIGDDAKAWVVAAEPIITAEARVQKAFDLKSDFKRI